MKATPTILASLLALSLAACDGHRGSKVPDMPYMKKPAQASEAAESKLTDGIPTQLSDSQLLPPINSPATPAAAVPSTPAASATPVPPANNDVTTSTALNSIDSALLSPNPSTSIAPRAATSIPTPSISIPSNSISGASTNTTAPIPTAPTATTNASSNIIDPGSMPVAKGVEGDPHRVLNPWNPAQRVRITNPQTGLPFPSGKILKIPGTDKKFIVP